MPLILTQYKINVFMLTNQTNYEFFQLNVKMYKVNF